jgi:hypothetical protein
VLTGWWQVMDLSDGVPIAYFLAKSDATSFRALCLREQRSHRFSVDEVLGDD